MPLFNHDTWMECAYDLNGKEDYYNGLPFYNYQNHNNFNTFNHVIGLPKKDGLEFPLFDYEQLLYDSLHKHKHMWIKKAIGLGITEFILRFMAWLCLRDNVMQSSQMCIVTGPRIELAITLIKILCYHNILDA